jgi:hypothetical protein
MPAFWHPTRLRSCSDTWSTAQIVQRLVVDGALRVEVLPLDASERSTAFQGIASAHLGRTVVPERQNQSQTGSSTGQDPHGAAAKDSG